MSFSGKSHRDPEDDEDDELAKRFKAVFNKDPVSKTLTASRSSSSWNARELHDYIVDDEEVPPLKRLYYGLTHYIAGQAD